MKLDINANIMDVNNAYAAENRDILAEKKILALNIIGSPGAGKTTFLERLLENLQGKLRVAVIEGDLATAKDAARIAEAGAAVVQINTDGGCHLDAKMISQVLPGFDLSQLDLLIIENVGNLVCPAGFDLGEDMRIVMMSVTEGNDKPSKYPSTFVVADMVIINKTDLLPYVNFDMAEAKRDIMTIKPNVPLYYCAASKEQQDGIDSIIDYFMQQLAAKRGK